MKKIYTSVLIVFISLVNPLIGGINRDLDMYAKSGFISKINSYLGVKGCLFGTKEYNACLLDKLKTFKDPGMAIQSVMQNAKKDEISTYFIIYKKNVTIEWVWEDKERHALIHAGMTADYDELWHPITVTAGLYSRSLPPEDKPVFNGEDWSKPQ